MNNEGQKILQENLVNLVMSSSEKELANILLETISLMGKRYVQRDWPSLMPDLVQYLQDPSLSETNLHCASLALEAIKKICSKYRYMFRSDALYEEMNYMIENLSPKLLGSLQKAMERLQTNAQQENEAEVITLISISSSVLHIFESILSQEELPDFYEESLPTITEACTALLELKL
jgi:exportin-2 (importin alpha re-exporter)